MLSTLADVVLWGGLAVFVFGLVKLLGVPFAVAYEVRERRRRRREYPTLLDDEPAVSVIVPAYNEGPVLAHCVRSICASDYPRLEVIVVDDGSSDDTPRVMRALQAQFPQVFAMRQANAGKGAALNRGIAAASGDVLLFVDADGVFAPETVRDLLRGFDSPGVGAVCGDDRPVNLDSPQTHLLTVVSHVGTGLVRRALTMLRCLPIVSGNNGAFPRSVVDEVGGFRTDTVGEDLELTWRVHRAGYRVNYRPSALVFAEVPSTVASLWRQRVRWARGLLETMRIHADMIGNPRYGRFGLYLVVNTLTMVVMPIVQLAVLVCLPFAILAGRSPVSATVLAVLGWVGVFVSIALMLLAIALNRAWGDVRYLYTLPLWPVYSAAMSAALVTALVQTLRGGPATWNKMTRTGVVSREARQYAGLEQ